MNKYTILLTGTIDTTKFINASNAIADTNVRLSQYENAITRYIKESAFNEIVFADNSGYDFDYKKFESLAKEYNKKFEFCSVTKLVRPELGKSYGDCQIIWEALETSKILKEAEIIYKITGRIFLANSKKVVKSKSAHRNEYIMFDSLKWCCTYFFKFNKKDYIEYFGNMLSVMENTDMIIENLYYPVIIQMIKDKKDVGAFRNWPYVLGVSGYSGERYQDPFIGRIYHTILSKIGAYNSGSPFQHILTLQDKLFSLFHNQMPKR